MRTMTGLAGIVLALSLASVASASADTGSGTTSAGATTVVEPLSHGFCNSRHTISGGFGSTQIPYISSLNNNHCIMSQGANSTGVTALRRALNLCNLRATNLSRTRTDYTSAVTTAVRNLQSSLGIGVDGVYGPQTRDAMTWPTGNPSQPCIRGGLLPLNR